MWVSLGSLIIGVGVGLISLAFVKSDLGRFVIGLKPGVIISFLEWKFPHIFFSMLSPRFFYPQRRWRIVLTIDDVPAESTKEILDLLQEHEAHATWFVIGEYAKKYPELIEDIKARGHELGNHTMTDSASWLLGREKFKQQLEECDKVIYPPDYQYGIPGLINDGIHKYKWFRPGCGIPTKWMVDIARERGYHIALGDIYPQDPVSRSPKVNSDFILKHAHPGGIIIIHDRPWTPEMLKMLLPELTDEFKIVSLSEMYSNTIVE